MVEGSVGWIDVSGKSHKVFCNVLIKKATLATCLKAGFINQKETLDAHAAWQQSIWESTLAALDGDSEDGSFNPPEGWYVVTGVKGWELTDRTWVSIREGLVRRLADLGLLSAQEVRDLLPDSSISEPWLGSGESLMVSFPLHYKDSPDV
jgi:hypothetical protein